ncbi:MAG TPA: EamA family transporter RarD [bacterium]|nr:EamA family transporter RarD [bacterium]
MTNDNYQKGLAASFSAFAIWGLAVIFWKQIGHVNSIEILTHRIIWSFVFIVFLFLISKRYNLSRDLQFAKNWKYLILTTLLLTANWLTFIWAVNSGHVVESSLGYFINPLVNVLLGWLFFREKLRKYQALAVGLAVVSVLVLTINYGHFPWIAFVLAFTFGLYGMVRKKINIKSIPGFGAEMFMAVPFALAYLIYLNIEGTISFLNSDLLTNILIVATGVVTAVPLLLFNYGVRHLPLKTVGFIQYITPTGMFILGVFVYKEPFSVTKLISFILIWAALAIYSFDNYFNYRTRKKNKENSS